MFCNKCGKEIPDDSQFCPKCGKSLGAVSPKKSHKLAGAILVVLVLGGIGAFVRQRFLRGPLPSPALMLKVEPGLASAQARASAVVPRKLSGEQIFKMATGGMILIQTFDGQGQPHAQGSGFIVSRDGLALTNYHVIRGASSATAKFSDGTVSDIAGVVSYDAARDVAVVKLDAPRGTPLQLGESKAVEVGERVVAIGSPLGLQNTLSVGIVSGLRNGVIQMSDPISPGSSGGAVFDTQGRVVGISVATVVNGQNLNFAVPIDWAKPYLIGGTPTALADVALQNTVRQGIFNGSVTVSAGRAQIWNVTVNPNAMSDAEIQGQVSSTGGLDGKISLTVLYRGQPVYQCRATACQIHQSIAAPGAYNLLLDNRVSPIFGRTVSGEIAFDYVK